ncbi:MAG: hypothetical protein IJ722_01620 [Alloprevotella sp.]|nr:hypothetical protein [Alloprevotella sp.]
MIRTAVLLTAELTAVVHLMMSLVMFYFARRSVRYLSQAWIMLLIGVMYSTTLVFIALKQLPGPGMLHPGMLMYLLVCAYLQSIYPLGVAMPGYLQWGRMWKYALPAIVLILIYAVGMLFGSDFAKVYEADDILEYFLSGDVVLRILALLLSFYYIANIFILPHRLVRRLELPRDIIAYGTLLGLVSLYFVTLTIRFDRVGYIVYMLVFTAINMFLTFRALRPVLDSISLPDIHPVAAPPTDEEVLRAAEEDFNEANRRRFERLEYVMQNEKPYTDFNFNRDRLCRYAGFNRHLALQCLRSQGYNDTHEYISRYRVAELRRLIEQGEVTTMAQTERAGFKLPKTAAMAFERYEGLPLAEFLEKNTQGKSEETSPAKDGKKS